MFFWTIPILIVLVSVLLSIRSGVRRAAIGAASSAFAFGFVAWFVYGFVDSPKDRFWALQALVGCSIVGFVLGALGGLATAAAAKLLALPKTALGKNGHLSRS